MTLDSSKKRRIMIITADEGIIEQLQNNGNASLFKSIILDSNGDDLEVSDLQPKNVQSEGQSSSNKKTKNDLLTCVVCSSPAHGYNFDAISCESCKAFFRRNALKDPATLECRRDRNCDVTVESRRRCSACRLTKCLNNGMKRDRLLTAEQKATKRRKIEENRSLTLHTQHEESETPEIIEEKPHILALPIPEPVHPVEDTNLLLATDLTDVLPQDSRTLLSSEELQRVEMVQLSYEQRIELAARDGLPWNPSSYATTLSQHLNSHSVSALRLLSFFKQIPEFNQLNAQDKLTLVKYNLMPLSILNCTLGYNQKTDSFTETQSDAPWNPSVFITVHGEEIYQRVRKIFECFVRIAEYDQRIIQLALIVLILMKGFSGEDGVVEPMLNDSIAVYRAQNSYTELLWKYMETMHGHGKAAEIFNELVVHFISWQTLQQHLNRNLHMALSSTELNELLPIMKSLLHIL